ncbi:amidohydrolase [Ruegeria arenilitoris]|uniref:amidohydrolase n=1 Tax=Ruegeria arenilitoris TaxID=1173585 RepID=UPI00147A625D|nr:amidohydrolase [Ruegeria arenilitoris]
MSYFPRRHFLKMALTGSTAMVLANRAIAQATSLSDVGAAIIGIDTATIFVAREIVTLDPEQPTAQAVAIVNDRVLASGTLEEVQVLIGDRPHDLDRTFEDHVIVPGFIAQHDHPILAGLTMSSLILSIEDWDLPDGNTTALEDKDDFMTRLAKAESELSDPSEPLLTWGYHAAFYGPLTRSDLDSISGERPIFAWARSCHEFVLNSAALSKAGVTKELVESWSESEQSQSNFEDGHFWEQGLFAVLPNIAPMIANPDKFRSGLLTMRDYMHAKGVTFGNEPGGILAKPIQDAVNAVMSAPSMPFRWTFIPDGKSLVATYENDADVIQQTKALVDWYGGMTSMVSDSVKLFSDGAIYSLAIQLRDPPIGDYHGEWMMDKDAFERAFRVYWDAGYQIHVHVNGDAGLDRVLNTLEDNLLRNPRFDHRTVIVHFAVSAPDQVDRIRRLGAIVSANPYYVTALSDRYGETGLGSDRADQMVRLGDLDRAGVSWSLHSDMPMAPGDPLFLMWCAVNRVTSSGRVAGGNQKVSAEEALRGVTINAAYSHHLEDELGSIEPGKLANFTILEENPLAVDPMAIKAIVVWGTVMEGRVQKVGEVSVDEARLNNGVIPSESEFAKQALNHALSVVHNHL